MLDFFTFQEVFKSLEGIFKNLEELRRPEF